MECSSWVWLGNGVGATCWDEDERGTPELEPEVIPNDPPRLGTLGLSADVSSDESREN